MAVRNERDHLCSKEEWPERLAAVVAVIVTVVAAVAVSVVLVVVLIMFKYSVE
jgi:hypothetical protein